MFYLSIYWEFHHPNWRTPSFFRGVGIPTTNQSSWHECYVPNSPGHEKPKWQMEHGHDIIFWCSPYVISCHPPEPQTERIAKLYGPTYIFIIWRSLSLYNYIYSWLIYIYIIIYIFVTHTHIYIYVCVCACVTHDVGNSPQSFDPCPSFRPAFWGFKKGRHGLCRWPFASLGCTEPSACRRGPGVTAWTLQRQDFVDTRTLPATTVNTILAI